MEIWWSERSGDHRSGLLNDAQRQATKAAGEIAGLNVRRIVNEPTAAAAYGLDKKEKTRRSLHDLGGGTFWYPRSELGDGVLKEINQRWYPPGGDDFDKVIMDWLVDESKRWSHRPPQRSRIKLWKNWLKKKKLNCSLQLKKINPPYITAVDGVPETLSEKLSRAKFEAIIDKLFERCPQALRTGIERCASTSQIDEVILVGGKPDSKGSGDRRKISVKPNCGVKPGWSGSHRRCYPGAVPLRSEKTYCCSTLPRWVFGIETMGGVMTRLIDSNKPFQTKNQKHSVRPAITSRVIRSMYWYGERPMANHTEQEPRYCSTLDGLPSAVEPADRSYLWYRCQRYPACERKG